METQQTQVLPFVALPPLWKVLKVIQDELDSLGHKISVEEPIAIPTKEGSYKDRDYDDLEGNHALGAAKFLYLGYCPIFKNSRTIPHSYDVCFHTTEKGVVTPVRFILNDTSPETIQFLNNLKIRANKISVCKKLGVGDHLTRYQWYVDLFDHYGLDIHPAPSQKSIATSIDTASTQAGIVRISHHGITTDDWLSAQKIAGKTVEKDNTIKGLGLRFNVPNDLLIPDYPSSSCGFLVSLLEDGTNLSVVVGDDLRDFLNGSNAIVKASYKGIKSAFRPIFSRTPEEAGELFLHYMGIIKDQAPVYVAYKSSRLELNRKDDRKDDRKEDDQKEPQKVAEPKLESKTDQPVISIPPSIIIKPESVKTEQKDIEVISEFDSGKYRVMRCGSMFIVTEALGAFQAKQDAIDWLESKLKDTKDTPYRAIRPELPRLQTFSPTISRVDSEIVEIRKDISGLYEASCNGEKFCSSPDWTDLILKVRDIMRTAGFGRYKLYYHTKLGVKEVDTISGEVR